MSDDIYARLGVIDSRLTSIERYLEKQNSRLEKSEDKVDGIDRRLIGIETKCLVVNQYGEKDHERMTKMQNENRERILDLVKQYGTVILSVLVLLNMIGSWVGWW